MSSRTSSRSTLTMVPSTMSPSLKYLMVASIAARKSASDPRSSTAILVLLALVLLALEVASMLLVMWAVAPVGMGVVHAAKHPWAFDGHGDTTGQDHWGMPLRCHADADLLPTEIRSPRVHLVAYRAHSRTVQPTRPEIPALWRKATLCVFRSVSGISPGLPGSDLGLLRGGRGGHSPGGGSLCGG